LSRFEVGFPAVFPRLIGECIECGLDLNFGISCLLFDSGFDFGCLDGLCIVEIT